ncbi:MAG: hypothetical protein AAF990_18735 [Bacteroidota bacterium]|mgnify:CR=1 FL=1
MKTLVKTVSLVMVLFFINTAFTDTNKPEFGIKTLDEKTFYFETKEVASDYVEITLQDENGTTLFSEYTTQTATFERVYNLEELAEGAYFLVVKSDHATQTLPIFVTTKSLEMAFEQLETI